MNTYKPRILIVDDERGLREGSKRLLEGEGYLVDTAENGTEGISLGVKNDYDIAVIDLKMPDIEGLEVLQEIKKQRPNTICFIATAFASYETAVESTRLGAFSYIPKPFTPEELFHQLKQGYKQRTLLLEAERLKKEREETLLEVAHEQSRLKTIIESISSGVLLVNREGEVVYFNHSTLQKLSIDNLEIGEYILDKLPTQISEILNQLLNSDNIMHKAKTTQVEIMPKGQLFIEATCSPVPHPDGSFAGVVIVLKNITGFKQVEQIKNQFVSMVAHELKTPIAAVLGYLKLILDENIAVSYEQQQEFLGRSHIRLQGLLDLVNDLLDISRMELKTKQREIEVINISEVIESTLQFLEFEIKKKGIVLVKDIKDQLPLLSADQNEINRVFINLISNAIKYNRDKGSITITCRLKGNYIITAISDTGIGLKPEEKSKLFQEFYRAKNKNTRGISGTGLGLSIVSRIVECYHGKIDVESEYEKGSTFTVYLPINK
ncbi:MAG: hybrid sensor histidine kinase/response regulator [Ignavibacteriae bacterium HGW-Ignavibacteriae-2]|nr:response regulator [Bacteroidota bacterium]PKL88563.1 MAG: hybrid sensor histidine kinase/response regulator [Ignavibacteriae bacterium HGW-Ignavibacteriae-2]